MLPKCRNGLKPRPFATGRAERVTVQGWAVWVHLRAPLLHQGPLSSWKWGTHGHQQGFLMECLKVSWAFPVLLDSVPVESCSLELSPPACLEQETGAGRQDHFMH